MNRFKTLFNTFCQIIVLFLVSSTNASYCDLNSPSKLRTLCCVVITKNPDLIKQAIKLPNELKERIASRYVSLNIRNFVKAELDTSISGEIPAIIRAVLSENQPRKHPLIEKLHNEKKIPHKKCVVQVITNPINSDEIAFYIPGLSTFSSLYFYNDKTKELKDVACQPSSISYLPYYENLVAQADYGLTKISFYETTSAKLIKSTDIKINYWSSTKLFANPHKKHELILLTTAQDQHNEYNYHFKVYVHNFKTNQTSELVGFLSRGTNTIHFDKSHKNFLYVANDRNSCIIQVTLQQPTLEEIVAKLS